MVDNIKSRAEGQWYGMMQRELEAVRYSAELDRETLRQMTTTLKGDDESQRDSIVLSLVD